MTPPIIKPLKDFKVGDVVRIGQKRGKITGHISGLVSLRVPHVLDGRLVYYWYMENGELSAALVRESE